MAYRHGITILEDPTPIVTPVEVDSALPLAFGTAPVHKLEDPESAFQKVFLMYSLQEGVGRLGYSDDWAKFNLSEVMYSQFRVHAVAPLACVNVWNPLDDAVDVAAVSMSVISGVITIADPMAMISNVTVKDAGGTTDYVRDMDYTLAYDDITGDLKITVIKGGAMDVSTVTAAMVEYKQAVITNITKANIIGGVASGTNKRTGIELADEMFLRYQKLPGFLLAPGWTDEPEVAAALMAKAQSLNSNNFTCIALLDMPCDATHADYSAMAEWRLNNGYTSEFSFAEWGNTAIGDKVFHLSTRLAGMHGRVDSQYGGIPYASASNQLISMTAFCQKDGTELPPLDFGQINFLNSNGIGSVFNWSGWRTFSDGTGIFPMVTDVKDASRPVRRMFSFLENTIKLTIWQMLDKPMNRLLIDRILLTVNEYLNGLTARGAILGGECQFLQGDNNTQSLLSGRIVFRVPNTPPTQAKDIEFRFVYDVNNLNRLFVA